MSVTGAKTVVWIALLVRILSQLVWEMYPTINLGLNEFIFGLVIATFVWIQLEILKFLTCLLGAVAFYNRVSWISKKLDIPGYVAIIAMVLMLVIISFINAYFWIFVDCQFIYNGTQQEGECIQRVLSLPDPSLWLSS